MSVRRHLISNELRYKHQTSPRKIKTHRGSSLFQPTILYKSALSSNPLVPWIGKKLIPWNGEYIQPYLRSVQLGLNNPYVISEFEIADYCKPNSYRILYMVWCPIHQQYVVKSKPQVDYVPSRLNIMLTTDNIIKNVLYF
jgi:hypothetical protein